MDTQNSTPRPDIPEAGDPGTSSPDVARRRLLKAGLSAAPIILTVRSRPAWAQGKSYPSMSYGDNAPLDEPVPAEGVTAPTAGAPAATDEPKKDKKPKKH